MLQTAHPQTLARTSRLSPVAPASPRLNLAALVAATLVFVGSTVGVPHTLAAQGAAAPTVAPKIAPTTKPRQLAARRFAADSFWVQLWGRGGRAEDDLFIEPRAITVIQNVVTILDLGTRELLAFSTRDGASLFTKESRGVGPGEFKRPARLIASPSHVGVLDQESARLSVFTARGALVWDTPIAQAADVESGCLLPDARAIIKVSGFDRALVVVDSAGRRARQFSLPQPKTDEPPPSIAQTATVAGPVMGDHCAVVPMFGAVWYTISPTGVVRTYPLIEPGAEAVVQTSSRVLERQRRDEMRQVTQRIESAPITSGAMSRGDTVIIVAAKTARDAYRLLDYYAVPSGQYLYSRRLPASFVGLAVDGSGTFFGTQIGSEFSVLSAIRPSATPPSATPPSAKR